MSDGDNDDADTEMITTISVRGDLLRKESWAVSNFSLIGLDVADSDTKWNVAHTKWSQVSGPDDGLVTFYLPVVAVHGNAYDLSRMHRLYSRI